MLCVTVNSVCSVRTSFSSVFNIPVLNCLRVQRELRNTGINGDGAAYV
jgi:hypothetical protein